MKIRESIFEYISCMRQLCAWSWTWSVCVVLPCGWVAGAAAAAVYGWVGGGSAGGGRGRGPQTANSKRSRRVVGNLVAVNSCSSYRELPHSLFSVYTMYDASRLLNRGHDILVKSCLFQLLFGGYFNR